MEKIAKSKLLASIAIMSALIAALTMLRISIPPLTVFNAGLLGVYIVSILFGPRIGTLSAGLGSGIAELYLMSTGDPPIFLFGLLAARMPAAGLIGILRKRFPMPGMVAGACLQTAIFLAIDIPILLGIAGSPDLLGPRFRDATPSLSLALSFGASLSWSLPFNILLVIPTHYIIKGIRAKIHKEFLY